jgi:hypothetical protein
MCFEEGVVVQAVISPLLPRRFVQLRQIDCHVGVIVLQLLLWMAVSNKLCCKSNSNLLPRPCLFGLSLLALLLGGLAAFFGFACAGGALV